MIAFIEISNQDKIHDTICMYNFICKPYIHYSDGDGVGDGDSDGDGVGDGDSDGDSDGDGDGDDEGLRFYR